MGETGQTLALELPNNPQEKLNFLSVLSFRNIIPPVAESAGLDKLAAARPS